MSILTTKKKSAVIEVSHLRGFHALGGHQKRGGFYMDEVVETLSDVIKLDTVNGNEKVVADYIAALLKEHGIMQKFHESKFTK